MAELREYKDLARDTGAYKDIEIDLLAETLEAWNEKPGEPYTLLDLRDGKTLAGFAVFCKAPGTDFTYDLRALCIEKAYIGKGVAPRLIEIIEEETLRPAGAAIIRSETSRKKEDAVGRGLYTEAGFACIGHIADFYEAGDDFFIYAKYLCRAVPVAKSDVAKIEVGEGGAAPGPAGEDPREGARQDLREGAREDAGEAGRQGDSEGKKG